MIVHKSASWALVVLMLMSVIACSRQESLVPDDSRSAVANDPPAKAPPPPGSPPAKGTNYFGPNRIPIAPPAMNPNAAPAAHRDLATFDPFKDRKGIKIPLPGKASHWVTAGGGSYLLVKIPDQRALVTVDLERRAIARTLEIKDRDFRVAGGATKFAVLDHREATLSRYDLATNKRELSVNVGDSIVQQLGMGCDSDGPLLVEYQDQPRKFFDLQNLLPIRTTRLYSSSGKSHEPPHVQVSGNGKAFVVGNGRSINEMVVLNEPEPRGGSLGGVDAGLPMPAASGNIIYHYDEVQRRGSMFHSATRIEGPWHTIPATKTDYALRVTREREPGRLPRVFLAHGVNHDPIMKLDGIVIDNTAPPSVSPAVIGGAKNAELPPIEERVIFTPAANTAVVVPPEATELWLYDVNIEQELRNTTVDYLFVDSPIPILKRREPVLQKLSARSKHGEIKYRLVSGPTGLTLTEDGELSWPEPTDSSNESSALIKVSDKSGREIEYVLQFEPHILQENSMAIRLERQKQFERPTSTPKPEEPPPFVRTHETIALGAEIGDICAAADGTKLIAALVGQRKVVVIDVATKKVERTIVVDDPQLRVAGGKEKLVVSAVNSGKLLRIDIATGKVEQTLLLEKPLIALAMGASSAGPFLGVKRDKDNRRDTARVLELSTLTPVKAPLVSEDEKREIEKRGGGDGYDRTQVREIIIGEQVAASGGSEIFTAWRTGVSPAGIYSVTAAQQEYLCRHEHEDGGILLPNADGRVICTGKGLATPKFTPFFGGEFKNVAISTAMFPAVTGSTYVQLGWSTSGSKKTKLSEGIAFYGGYTATKPWLNLTGIPLPEKFTDYGKLAMHKKFFLLSGSNQIAVVEDSLDAIRLYTVDIKQELENTGENYLYVDSTPPRSLVAGKTLKYQVQVVSKHPEIRYRLASDDLGAKISPTGEFTWESKPDSQGSKSFAILVTAGDDEVVHGFEIDVRAPTNTMIIAGKDAGDAPRVAVDNVNGRTIQTLKLPGQLTELVVGGSGKYLCGYIPRVKQVVIIDVAAKKIAKYLPVDDEKILLAAGADKLVVALAEKGIVNRFDLNTFERELSTTGGPFTFMTMGSSSAGPIGVVTGKDYSSRSVEFLDLKSLKNAGIRVSPPNIPHGVDQLQASADGGLFAGWRVSSSPTGVMLFEVADKVATGTYAHESAGALLPSPDGRIVYSQQGMYAPNSTRLNSNSVRTPFESTFLLPATSGSYYLALAYGGRRFDTQDSPKKLELRMQGQEDAILTLTGIRLPHMDQTVRSGVGILPVHKRLFLMPAANALVTVPLSLDQIEIHEFSIKNELANGTVDYLFVSSQPPNAFTPGTKVSYKIEVESKRGNVNYRMDGGPPGAAVSPQGELTWSVPASFDDVDVVIICTISDASKQEISHTIKLTNSRVRKTPPPGAPVPKKPALPQKSPVLKTSFGSGR